MTRDSMWYVSRGSLLVAILLTLALKVPNLSIGAPHVTIDDSSGYTGGFLVWFGHAPPQRMYLESWIYGVSSLATYAGKMIRTGQISGLGPDIVAEAYRDFHNQPDAHVRGYRGLMLVFDLATAALVFVLGRALMRGKNLHWVPYVAAALYLLSFNTVWCDVVARPDTVTAFFGILGLLGYYRSDFGRVRRPFILGAIALGICAGMKLHGALFVVFILLDMARHHGVRRGLAATIPFALVSLVAFAVAAGSPLFDPLLYVKLRMLNIEDDKSPWLNWGDQFVTALRGAGWIFPPLLVWAAVVSWRERGKPETSLQRSLTLLACCWLVIFLSIRQLRAYWMLPALPLFYLAGLAAVERLPKPRILAPALVVALMLVMGWQSADQAKALRGVRYGELREWVRENISPEDPFYIFGFGVLDLPKNTLCMSRDRQGLEQGLAEDIAAGTPHFQRHLKNWEERSTLALMDMLGFRNEQGYEFYSYYGSPLDRFAGIIDIGQMKYLLVQEGFENPPDFPLQKYLAEHYVPIASGITSNGGGRNGLKHQIFVRRERDAP